MSTEVTNKCLGFIGAGVMGSAFLKSLLTSGIKPRQICVYEKMLDNASEVATKFGVNLKGRKEIGQDCEGGFLAVKPQEGADLLEKLKGKLKESVRLISMAAGKKSEFIEKILDQKNPVIRVMPNTPTLIGKGMAGYSLSAGVTDEQKNFVDSLLAATGKAIEIPEDLQNALTGTSGSGPAYFFRFVEAMVDGAVAMGLSHEDATTLTIQTIVGAAALLDESGDTPTRLREKVTSLKGATAEALAVFDQAGISKIVADAMAASARRAGELAQ